MAVSSTDCCFVSLSCNVGLVFSIVAQPSGGHGHGASPSCSDWPSLLRLIRWLPI